MKLSRRDFIHAGCSIAAASFPLPIVDKAEASFPHGYTPLLNPLNSQRSGVNVSQAPDSSYAFINHYTQGDGVVGPTGTNYTATSNTWMQLIDQNGYPNIAGTNGGWGGGFRIPSSSNFSAPYVFTWDGEGRWSVNQGTWTEASTTTALVGNANGTTTLSGFLSVAGIGLQFDVTGAGVPASTTVVSVNYATNTIVVSNAVTTGTGVTFSFANNTYVKNSNGNWSAAAGKKAYVVASNSGLASPANVSFNNTTTGGTSISVSSLSWFGGVVTATTASPHGRPIGYSLYLTFSGVTPSSLNATFLCTVTGASTYTFALVSSPGAISGTITYVAYSTNVAIYRQVDEVDFMPATVGGNGLVFRKPYKQVLVNLNPAFLRFLNLDLVNNSNSYRFENRSLPSKAGTTANWTAGPAYGKTSGNNAITLAAATGTAGNSQVTPASMLHGEVVQCLMTNGITRAGTIAITGISQANPGQVTAAAHGKNNGDVVQIICGTSNATGNPYTGMVELNFVPVTVTVIDANNFTIGIDTTTFTAFTAGVHTTAFCCVYVSLQVGSGNDRVAYPVLTPSCAAIGQNQFGTIPFVASTYMSFVFDKNISGVRSAGTALNWMMGAWVATGSAAAGIPSPISSGTSIEQMTALVVEVNQLSQSQGIANPIHMWLNIPHKGLAPVDPDYSASSDYALNAVSVVMAGANGFKGLVGNTQASLILENSNETWNPGFVQTFYGSWLNYIRNGAATSDPSTMAALRSTIMARNITANSPYRQRTKLTLGVQGIAGYGGVNLARLNGTGTNYFSDVWNTWQGSLTPISQHDACNPATYFDPTAAYTNTVTGIGTFTDDSAMFNGTDNSSNGGGNYSGAANQTQAIANFVSNIVNGTGSGQQTIAIYCSQANPSAGLIAQYTTNLGPLGKSTIQYEGSADWQTGVGGGLNSHTITSADSSFLQAVYQSQAWATAQGQFFSNCATLANAGPGTIFNMFTVSSAPRWAYIWPDSYSGGVEGGAFTASPMWTTLGARNQALPN